MNFENFKIRFSNDFFDESIESDDQSILFTIYLSQMYYYSTVDLSDSVVFIGGSETEQIVAKFNGNEWSRLPDLKQGRSWHGSIQIKGKTFIIGGFTYDRQE